MNTTIHRVHLHDLRSSQILHPDWSVSAAAALVGALLLAPMAMFAFASTGVVVAVALVGAGLGLAAAASNDDGLPEPQVRAPLDG
jgi:hypothetical protein